MRDQLLLAKRLQAKVIALICSGTTSAKPEVGPQKAENLSVVIDLNKNVVGGFSAGAIIPIAKIDPTHVWFEGNAGFSDLEIVGNVDRVTGVIKAEARQPKPGSPKIQGKLATDYTILPRVGSDL